MIYSASPLPASIAEENLTIELTTRCTNACTHCFARAGMSSYCDLPVETAQTLLAEGYELGYRHLHLTGGEPFLWKDIFPLIERAFSSGYETVFINTNGALLDTARCAALSKFGEGLMLSLSLQGPRELHERVRGEGSFDKACNGLYNALEAGVKTSVYTTVGRGIMPQLPRFAEWLFSAFQRVERLILIQLVRVHGDALDLADDLLAPDDFIALVKTAALLNLYFDKRISILENPLAGVVASLLEMPWLPKTPPLLRDGRIVIMANNSITCAHSVRNSIGVYTPGMLRTALQSKEYRDSVSEDEVTCPQCRFLGPCRESGMLRPSEPFRDMDETIPYCKRVLRLIDGVE